IICIGVAAVIVVAALHPIPQPLEYHNFAYKRALLGVPKAGDVLSNLPFVIAGILGLFFTSKPDPSFTPGQRWSYIALFAGLLLTGLGSGYYHLAPDNERLIWDRLPMTIVFMPLVAALIVERVSLRRGLWLLPVLSAIGICSVIQWHLTEQHGRGDLRFYLAVQVYAVLALFAALLLPARYTRESDLLVVAGFYVLAKICETADQQIFSVGHLVSGHTLKHLSAG